MFVPGKPFQLSLMFAGKARGQPRGEHLKDILPANIGIGWKGLPGTNALAYYKKAWLTAVKNYSIGLWG